MRRSHKALPAGAAALAALALAGCGSRAAAVPSWPGCTWSPGAAGGPDNGYAFGPGTMTVSDAAGYRTVTVKLWRADNMADPLDSISYPLATVTLPVTGTSFTVAAPGSITRDGNGSVGVSDPSYTDLGHVDGIGCGVTSVSRTGAS